jgi:hypothetical protein
MSSGRAGCLTVESGGLAGSVLALPERDLARRRHGDDAAPSDRALPRLEQHAGTEYGSHSGVATGHSTIPPPSEPPSSSA